MNWENCNRQVFRLPFIGCLCPSTVSRCEFVWKIQIKTYRDSIFLSLSLSFFRALIHSFAFGGYHFELIIADAKLSKNFQLRITQRQLLDMSSEHVLIHCQVLDICRRFDRSNVSSHREQWKRQQICVARSKSLFHRSLGCDNLKAY